MDKKIAKELSEIAKKLPIVFNQEEEIIHMSGEELNLTGYGEHRTFEKNKYYEVPVPLFRAVEHRQQLKDAFKKDKMNGVHNYIQTFCNKVNDRGIQ